MKKVVLKTGETVTILEPSLEDAEAMINYAKKVGDETANLTFAGEDFNMTVTQEEAFIVKHKEAKNQICLISKIEGEIVGMLNVASSSRKRIQHIGEIGISIAKAHWGKQIGTMMFEEVIAWAKSGGIIKKIDLSVLTDNERAVKLYERLGFKHEGVRSRASWQEGMFLDTYMMGLEID